MPVLLRFARAFFGVETFDWPVALGVDRSFRDREQVAYEAARYLKQRHPADLVEVRIRATGQRILMLEEGRTG